MSEPADWLAWIVIAISLGLAAILFCFAVLGAVRDRRDARNAVPEPRD